MPSDGTKTGHVTDLMARAAAFVGIGIACVYALGFVAANAFYGRVWVIDPSLLQARYAAAGLLWMLVFAANLVPAYYAVTWWRDRHKRTELDAYLEGQRDRAITRWAEWLKKRRPATKWALTAPVLAVVALPILALALILLAWVATPFFSVILLMMLGAHPAAILFPAWGLHLLVVLWAMFSFWGGLDLKESLDFRNEPHRALMVAGMVILHAVVFGHFVYPHVPPSGGGGRPLAARVILAPEVRVASWLRAGPDPERIENAYIVGEGGGFLLVLVPLESGPGESDYCPLAVRSDKVVAVEVKEDVLSYLLPLGNGSRLWTWIWPAPRIRRCPPRPV